MSYLGHNGGPSLEGGTSWRTHCWRSAREALLPTLPIEIVRLRVKRAQQLGLDYKTYAGVRATTGRDIVAFLFSSNAFEMVAPTSAPHAGRAAKAAETIDVGRVLAVHRPLIPDQAASALERAGVPILYAGEAPSLAHTWSETRGRILSLIRPGNLPSDGVVVVGSTPLEQEWVVAARLAAFMPADRYFSVGAQGL